MKGLNINKISTLGVRSLNRNLLSATSFKRFGSTESENKTEEKYPEETFFSPWWKRSIYVIAGFYAWSKFDATFFSEGHHPITRWIEFHQESEEESKQKQVIMLKSAQERARIRLLEAEPVKIGFKKICTPDLFTRASQHGIVPGSQTDLSDMEIKC
ncbi:hypothetical protein K502DRAFT_362121 [Neoconidiobolus thromboides FSU 785]|nr:hypothetical protein K502DRAFT_362121 [Neoconidiobolus thromboides FSU 785]